MHIVVIDHSPTNCRVVRNSLKQLGYGNVSGFLDREVAASHLTRYSCELVIISKQLRGTGATGMSGIIRRRLQLLDVPILIIADHFTHEELLECMDMGADSFLLRPFSFKELRKKVESLIEG